MLSSIGKYWYVSVVIVNVYLQCANKRAAKIAMSSAMLRRSQLRVAPCTDTFESNSDIALLVVIIQQRN
jgi:hypothetical protein